LYFIFFYYLAGVGLVNLAVAFGLPAFTDSFASYIPTAKK